jgi:hypothetical protein
MNRTIKTHYPVSALPEDLRHGLSLDGEVTVILEENGFPIAKKRSVRELFAARRPPFRSAEDIDRDLDGLREDRND